MQPNDQNVKIDEKNERFKNIYQQFISNSSLAGFSHLDNKHGAERFIWCIIHILSFCFTIFLILYSWNNFMANPMVTTVDAIGSRILEVEMPGISICNINKISKWKAERYAAYLSLKSKVPIEEILQNITLLGYLYEYNLPHDSDRLIHFQSFLDEYDSTTDDYFNTTKILHEIQPSCEEIVQNCRWESQKKPCSDLFVTELTMDGYCCVFNYLSQHSTTGFSSIIAEHNNKPVTFGPSDSLDFTVIANTSDTFFTTLATDSPTKLLISLPTDFPDTTSGSLTEIVIDKGIETVLRISSAITDTMLEVKKYPISKRNCLFREEAHTIFGSYSYSDCIMDCKIKSIVALCQCIPYNFIHVFKNQNNQYYQCTLSDLICLNSYSNKWKTLYPVNYDGDGLDREKQDSIQCQRCVPACSDTMYEVTTDDAEILINGSRVNFSIVHIIYEKSLGVYNKQDVFYYWYDMIGMFGGLCSVTMGLSFISIFEIVYYFIYLIIKNNTKRFKFCKKNKLTFD